MTLEQAIEYIDRHIAEIDGDERYHYKRALVDINAPLALIQVDMDAEMRMLKTVRKLLTDEDSKVGKAAAECQLNDLENLP
jgi:hypothetical protein